MGVPGLFSFLRRRYPLICSPVEKRKRATCDSQRHVDNLYIDMNHIIHSCTHAHVAKDRTELSLAEMFAGMAAYLQQLLDLLEPRRTVMVAIDGVAPRAKMNQQRTRRFMSAYIGGITDKIEAEVRREMAAEAGGDLAVPSVERFDSNIITPGTDFMLQLADWLRQWAASIVVQDSRFRHCCFIISDASEPGEGEHKIMRYVRHLKLQPDYDPSTRHVVYGQDADLLLLSLLCHEPYFTVMRERHDHVEAEQKIGGDHGDEEHLSAVEVALRRQLSQAPSSDQLVWEQQVHSTTEATAMAVASASHAHLHIPHFEQVDIGVLRECLQWEFSDLVGPPGPSDMYSSSTEHDIRPGTSARHPDSTSVNTGASGLSAIAESASDDSSDDLQALLELTVAEPTTPAAAGRGSCSDATTARTATQSSHHGLPRLSFESLLDDLVMLSFLAGNDFLPHVPSIDIYDKPCGLDLLFTAYKELLPKLGGHISSAGSINRSRLVQLLVYLARDEEPAFKRRSEYRQRRAAQERDKQAAAVADLYSMFDGGLSMGELPPGLDVAQLDQMLQQLGPDLARETGLSAALAAQQAAAVDLRALSPGQLCEELHNRVAARVKERLMGGDPWAQDPVGLHLPGYRQRYYEMRFPELYQQLDGDIDRVAGHVTREFLDGMEWVLRYYACGPASLNWKQQPQQQVAARDDGLGASWTWCYSFHYAPLMQDLAKGGLRQSARSSKAAVCHGPISISRDLDDPVACALDEWAPVGGPVRPLLQLMCVLPAKSVRLALPAPLAHLIVLAEAMEEEHQQQQQHQDHCSKGMPSHQQMLPVAPQQQGHLSKAARKQARKAAVAARVQGLQGLEVLTVLEDEEQQAAHSNDDDSEGCHQVEQDPNPADGSTLDSTGHFRHLLCDDVAMSMQRLAQQLSVTFPSDVQRVVDLTGKKWLHTGVVRLPMAEPQHLAAVLQAVLVLQQQQQPWQDTPWQQQQQQRDCGSSGLTDVESSRNTFKPAVLITSASAARKNGINQATGFSSPVDNSSNSGTSSNPSNSSNSGTRSDVWGLLTRTRTTGTGASAGPVAQPCLGGAPGVAQQSVAAATRRLGALGMMLAQSGGMHTLSDSTMRRLVPEQQETPFTAEVDVAGLSVPTHDCCLLQGAEPPPLTVTAAAWRRIAAGFASSINYAQKVLGCARLHDNNDNGGTGGAAKVRGRGRGPPGGGDSRGRGRPRGTDITRQVFEHYEVQRQQQAEQQKQLQAEFFMEQVSVAAADQGAGAPTAPADMSAYFYSPATAGDQCSSANSRAAHAFYNFCGYDDGYTHDRPRRGKGRMGVGNRGRSYRTANR